MYGPFGRGVLILGERRCDFSSRRKSSFREGIATGDFRSFGLQGLSGCGSGKVGFPKAPCCVIVETSGLEEALIS